MRGCFQSLPYHLAILLSAGAVPAAAQDAPQSTPDPVVINNPQWEVRPRPDFPQSALTAGVTDGKVIIDCGFKPDGYLTGCLVIEETPGLAGLGGASLEAAGRARLTLGTVADAPDNARVRLLLRFLLGN